MAAGGAKVLLEGEFDANTLYDTVCCLLSKPDELAEMSANMRSLAVDDAVDRICSIVLELIEHKK